ncbi:MAG: DUF116 domain-containing protein [Candidatus Nezhaarchaeota archaeon]|nr:DUF116 domain-containing protein [Candidatus Nezhaarchaeota archaeon]
MASWRLLDTGLRGAAENMALDDAILEAVSLGAAPNTLRFLRFSRPCVLVGLHQDVRQEVRLDYCRERGVEVNRRITGGGAVYFEPRHLGWEIIARWEPPFPSRPEGLYEFICEAVAEGLRRLGVEAKYRPVNDIEVRGRKVSGTGGTARGGAFLFQGTLLTDLDLREMLRCLRVPIKKLSDKEVESLKDRVTTLAWELGVCPSLEAIKSTVASALSERLGASFTPGGLTELEEELLRERLPYFSSSSWVELVKVPESGLFHSSVKAKGGLIRAAVSVRGPVIQAVYITGDFFTYPPSLVNEVEARLKHLPIDRGAVERAVEEGLRRGVMLGVEAGDIAKAVVEAASKVRLTSLGLTSDEADCLIEVLRPAEYVLSRASYLLLPYCAKPLDCEFRWSQGCSLCGRCSFTEVYGEALKLGFSPVTIVNYEHLERTLTGLKEAGEEAWIGSCCEAFYEKRMEDFERIGLPGLIVTTEGLTCYDLGMEKLAYEGRYEGTSKLRADVIVKLLKLTYSLRRRALEARREALCLS